MGVACQILINKTREGVHKPGQPITGTVKYAVDEPTEFQNALLSFLGKGECSWTESGGNYSTTYYGHDDYVTHYVNILKKRRDEKVTLFGSYEHPFEFFLPEDVPPTFKDSICNISYRIELKFEKASFFSFNKTFSTEIPVYGNVSSTTEGPVIFGLEKTLFSLFSSKSCKVQLKAEIAKTRLSPGENAQLTYVVTNDTDVVIPSVRTDLFCYTTYIADCGRSKSHSVRIKRCESESPSVLAGAVGNFSCTLPILPELYSIQHSKIVSKEYRVRVTVRLPLPHIDASVVMPIVIGERKGGIEPCIEAIEDLAAQPPSYWEVMSEGKEKE